MFFAETLIRSAARLLRDETGNVAMIFALMIIPALGLTGVAVDYSQAVRSATKLQAVADAAAIAGARLPATANQNRQLAAQANFDANIAQSNLPGAQGTIQASNAEVSVRVTYSQPTTLSRLFHLDVINLSIAAAARSQVDNGAVTCLLALNPTVDQGLHLQGINKLSDQNCWAWVNSTSGSSIYATGAATATAQGFCTAGGVVGADHFLPAPYTGCDPIADPFAAKFAGYSPPGGPCLATNLVLKSGTYSLQPGTYCGGLSLKPHATVTFQPGLYVIKDGPLVFQGQSTASGTGVSFYFTGSNTSLQLLGGGNASLRAPASGDLASFLFIQDPASNPSTSTVIQGGGSVTLEGVLYAPTWVVNIGGNGQVNQNAPYWAMVADSFRMEGNGTLNIRSNASAIGLPSIMPLVRTGPVLIR